MTQIANNLTVTTPAVTKAFIISKPEVKTLPPNSDIDWHITERSCGKVYHDMCIPPAQQDFTTRLSIHNLYEQAEHLAARGWHPNLESAGSILSCRSEIFPVEPGVEEGTRLWRRLRQGRRGGAVLITLFFSFILRLFFYFTINLLNTPTEID